MIGADTVQIIKRHTNKKTDLLAILEEIQGKYSYLPEQALRIVSEETGRSLVDIYSVATFYKAFSLKPRGKHLVSCCLGTACHVRNAPKIVEEFERQLEVEVGETTSDREFTLERVNCLGACALGPVVVVDGHYFSQVSPSKVKDILKKSKVGLDKVEITGDERFFPVEVSCPRCNHSLMDPNHPIDGYPSIRVTVSHGRSHGGLSLSSVYGSYQISIKVDIPTDTVVNFFCPHCYAELVGGSDCPECGLGMVPMIVRGGGIVQICPRRGCKGHLLDMG